MQRREALGLFGGLAFLRAPEDANAQTRSSVRRVGVIATGELASLQRAWTSKPARFEGLGGLRGRTSFSNCALDRVLGCTRKMQTTWSD